ncbi:unnamed protein product [Ceratitis capitata]|uniref:(Mediterranean fruit fly) hypothetical protein n=2 Tax=Ceratitis capitata TaxID=7213 RepID=A0A811U337_CERCA|nr:unnamed protein product [Ceratitis capitata]
MMALHFGVFLLGICLLIQLTCMGVAAEKAATRGKNSKTNTHEDATTPSPEWLAYQRERFSNAKDVETLKKMLDPASQLLKNKEQIIMPTKTIDEDSRLQEAVSSQDQKTTENTKLQIEGKEAKPEDNISDEEKGNEDEVVRSKEDKTTVLMHVIKGLQSPSLQGFLSFLSTVKRSWVRQSRLTIEQKLSKLKKLKHRMMLVIEDGFNTIWTPKVHMRRKRGILEESNLNFPPETALITINFLTFAVFLIKLVMQVVHIVKSKHYTLSGFDFTKAGTVAL